MDDDKLAARHCTAFTVFYNKVIHTRGDYLIIDAELIPWITICFSVMLNRHDQLAGIRENPNSAPLGQSHKLNPVAYFSPWIGSG